jgi:biopolymer transport protein ExbB
MIDFFVKGGVFMYPILACSLVSLAVIVERLILFIRTRDRREALERCAAAAGRGDLDAAAAAIAAERGTAAGFLRELLAQRREAGASGERLRAAAERSGDAALKSLGRGLHLLDLVERLSPLFGFLGTVVGMVAAFMRISAFTGPVTPALIADGIYQALITTVAGLLAAIPALIASHFFTAALRERAGRMREYAEPILNDSPEAPDARLS